MGRRAFFVAGERRAKRVGRRVGAVKGKGAFDGKGYGPCSLGGGVPWRIPPKGGTTSGADLGWSGIMWSSRSVLARLDRVPVILGLQGIGSFFTERCGWLPYPAAVWVSARVSADRI